MEALHLVCSFDNLHRHGQKQEALQSHGSWQSPIYRVRLLQWFVACRHTKDNKFADLDLLQMKGLDELQINPSRIPCV